MCKCSRKGHTHICGLVRRLWSVASISTKQLVRQKECCASRNRQDERKQLALHLRMMMAVVVMIMLLVMLVMMIMDGWFLRNKIEFAGQNLSSPFSTPLIVQCNALQLHICSKTTLARSWNYGPLSKRSDGWWLRTQYVCKKNLDDTDGVCIGLFSLMCNAMQQNAGK